MIVLLWINKTLRQSFFTVSNYLIITFSVITGVQVIACLWLKYETATMEYWMILTVFIVIALLTDLVASRFAKKVSFNGIKLKSSCESTFMSKHEKRFNIICVFAAMYSVTYLFSRWISEDVLCCTRTISKSIFGWIEFLYSAIYDDCNSILFRMC